MFAHTYNDIISINNLLESWHEFLRGKRKRKDVSEFSLHFMDNIISLHSELKDKTYTHGTYHAFKINDPKPRDIHKATVRDRLLHHAVYKILYPYFDKKYIYDSYSCRTDKGTHKAIKRLEYFTRKVSKNNTRTVWVLKCDIQKFFANIDHKILKNVFEQHIDDPNILWLLDRIISSFHTNYNSNSGLPLGNLTSQLFVNIYMNEFDQFVKRKLKAKYYIRYADDFVILHTDKSYLRQLTPQIAKFLNDKLKLSLHPNKLFLKTIDSGVDFLGWVNFSHHRVLRTSTKHRMFKKLNHAQSHETTTSYLGLLSHGNAYRLREKIKNQPNHAIIKCQKF